MGSQVKLILLCSSFGHTLSQEIDQRGEARHLRRAPVGKSAYVAKALISVAGVPVINYWLAAAQNCSRLTPLKDKVYIVCNNDNIEDFQNWAKSTAASGGFPVANIFNNGISGDERRGPLLDLVAAIKHFQLSNDHIAVVDCDFIFEPAFNLQRIIEHAMVRGKDILTFMTPPAGADLANQVVVRFQDSVQEACPKVSAIDPTPNAISDGLTSHVVAPLLIFRRNSIPLLTTLAESGPPLWKQLIGAGLQGLAAAGVPLYALKVDFFFNVRTLDDLRFTNAFFGYYLRLNKGKLQGVPSKAGSHLDFDDDQYGELALTRSAMAQPIARDKKLAGAIELMAEQSQPSDLRETLMEFVPTYQASLKARHDKSGTDLPDRFTNLELRTFEARKQHPVYTTTSNDYGKKKPEEFDMPGTWAGIAGYFTNSFPGPYRNLSLVTAVTKSKVHKALDDF